MPDFLTNLTQRFLGTAPLVQPRLPSFFASGGREAGLGSAQAEFAFPIRTESGIEGVEGIAGIADAGHPSGAESATSRTNAALHPASPSAPISTRSSLRSDQEKETSSNSRANRSEQTSRGKGREVGLRNESNRSNQSQSSRHSSLLPPLEESSAELRSGREIHSPDDISNVVEGGEGRDRMRERDHSLTSHKVRSESANRESDGEGKGRRNASEENTSRHLPLRLVPSVPNDVSASSETISKTIGIEGREEEVRGRAAMKFEQNPFGPISENRFAESERGGNDNVARSKASFQSLLPASSGEEMRKGEGMGREVGERNTTGRDMLLLPDHASRNEFGGVTSLPLIARDNPEAENSSSRTINVTIGRIEVRGTPNQKSERRHSRPPVEKSPPPSAAMSLDDYLKRYNRRGE